MADLGSRELSSTVLSGAVTQLQMLPHSPVSYTGSVQPTTTVEAQTGAANAVTRTNILRPVTLSPENIHIVFDEQLSEFRSNWFKKQTPLHNPGELVIVGEFRPGDYDPIDIIVERDDNGDDKPETRSEVVTLKDDTHVLRIEQTEDGGPIAEDGGRYRLRFPNYSQTDALDRLHLALAWDNDKEMVRSFDLDSINLEGGPQAVLTTVLLSETYNFDAKLDEAYESYGVETSNWRSLDRIAREAGISRDENENDPHLRKRAQGHLATRTFSTTGPDVSDLLALLFEDEVEKVSVGVADNEPVLEIRAPAEVIENHILTVDELETILDDAVASSYSSSVKKQ